jgi:hypothetical protein
MELRNGSLVENSEAIRRARLSDVFFELLLRSYKRFFDIRVIIEV